jgi:hypothetical protein
MALRDVRHTWIPITTASLALVGLAVVYLVLLRLALDSSLPNRGYTQDERDALYLIIHGGILVAAPLLGFLVGKFFHNLGFAFGLLFLAVIVVVMVATLIGSRELACRGGHNDLVRHWTCSSR